MISNFIAHLQRSQYKGEKFTRPVRIEEAATQTRRDTLRAAQLVNIKAAEKNNPTNP